jgi:hypothetical protein
MSAEFYITFEDKEWLNNNKQSLEKYISGMDISTEIKENEYWLKENDNPYYDVRLLIINDNTILLEIAFHPKIIEESLQELFSWIRNKTKINIKDDDGELSNW